MRRLTIYLPDELHDAIVAHADAAGQKLSTFVSRELGHLVSEPAEEGGAIVRMRHATSEVRQTARRSK